MACEDQRRPELTEYYINRPVEKSTTSASSPTPNCLAFLPALRLGVSPCATPSVALRQLRHAPKLRKKAEKAEEGSKHGIMILLICFSILLNIYHHLNRRTVTYNINIQQQTYYIVKLLHMIDQVKDRITPHTSNLGEANGGSFQKNKKGNL